jgi:hypothetical protein
MSAILETVVIGFGVVGAVVAGNAAAQTAKATGCTESQQLAAGCVGAGLAVAVLPAAAVAGMFVTGKAAYDLATQPAKREALRAKIDAAADEAKAQTQALTAKARGMTTVVPKAAKRAATKA